MLNVVAGKNFKKSFKKKDKLIQKKALERLRFFREDPYNVLLNNHALTGEHKGRRSFNVTGDYRIIFYHLDENTIKLVDIGTNPELYG